MAAARSYRVRRVEVADGSVLGERCDYADAFAVELSAPDAHSPEEWARAALEQVSPVVRAVIRVAQARVLRLRLRPRTDGSAVLGWPVVASTSTALHLHAAGPLLRGDIVGRRTSPQVVVLTTSLVFERRLGGALWLFVGPLHRHLAGRLLDRAAASLTAASGQPP